MRGEAGEHIASNPPYGYVKDPQDKKKWIVDEEAAKVVQRIFNLCIAGKGPMQIAKILRMENPVENQKIFVDTQPAIIEKGQWERVQELRKNKRRPTKTGRTSMFSGLLYCADCWAKLYFCTCNTYKDDSQNHFVCSNYKSNTGSCKIHYIR